ncbi:MAG: CHRD domain-containing protein [Acidimicrobiia bacterium]|nr:CHRD domain-containing protein [Acidimicrobiia bacterium]
MRRPSRLAAVLLLPLAVSAASCSDDGSPVVDAGGAATTEAAPDTAPPPGSDDVTFVSLSLRLTGDTEVPAPGSAGIATADLTYDGDQMCLQGSTSDVGPIIGGHVHAAPVGEAGDVVVDFELSTTEDGAFEACEVVGAEGGVIVEDPTNYYVNLHTEEFPDGAVRAQVG